MNRFRTLAFAVLSALLAASPETSAQLDEVEFLLEFEAERGRTAPPAEEPFSQPGAPPAGERRTFDGIEFVFVPGGEFERGGGRGGGNAGPRHRVTLTSGFWLSRTEITQSQWSRVMNSAPWRGKPHAADGPDQPATHVSHDDAMAFAAALNAASETGGGYRLPTEAEWERGCRAGTATIFAFGDDIGQTAAHAWIEENTIVSGAAHAHDVAKRPANQWGLHDMHGNVMEWCSDWYEAYGRRPQSDPKGPEFGSVRVCRGGSWLNLANQTSSAHRTAFHPSFRSPFIGFRLAKQLLPSELNPGGPGR